jgi:DNA (cytosine-5)-methyltransferase 1
MRAMTDPNEKLRVLDLFAGIGGFSFGLERAGGFETVAFCEIEKFPQQILRKHWPEVPIYEDVRTLTAERLAADGIAVDVITGGFPCQDISTAGKGAGLAGERSGLFYEIARLIGELAPRYVVLENVAALLSRGLGDVLGTLAEIGYDAEWHCIPASYLGAPHRRDRIWIVAYPAQLQRNGGKLYGKHGKGEISELGDCGGAARNVADTNCSQCQGSRLPIGILAQYADAGSASWWGAEPDVGRVANGVPDRAHRLKALGNAVVPQIPELIGSAILANIKNERPTSN